MPLFLRNLSENVALCLVQSVLESSVRACKGWMELDWRQRLTRRLHEAYFDKMAYYRVQIGSQISIPEQRIVEDVPKFTHGLADVTVDWITGLIDTVFYTVRLKQYTQTHRYAGGVLGYILCAGVATAVVSPPFGRIYKRLQDLEGEYQRSHARLRGPSEKPKPTHPPTPPNNFIF